MPPHWQPFLSLHGISNNIRNSSGQSANASTNKNRTLKHDLYSVKLYVCLYKTFVENKTKYI
jgi:hypothetical protein